MQNTQPARGVVRAISFIIPAWNEESTIVPTIGALKAATRHLSESVEIIVADDASTDRTAELARQHGARVVTVRNRQIAATRNAGAANAAGDLLIFVDADTIVTVPVIRAAITAIRQGAVGGGCGLRFDGYVPFYGRMLETFGGLLFRMLRVACGCFLFCTREAFDAVGGFDTGLYAGEEGAISIALKRRGRFVVLNERVITSGRKLRAHSAREVFGTMFRMIVLGTRNRKGMDIWYGERRRDPLGIEV